MEITRLSVPIGVIGIIYESRPNVTADAGGLCLKSGNAAILRGGSDAHESSSRHRACLSQGLAEAGLDPAAIQMVPTADRAAVGDMLAGLGGTIDLIVPRGGKSLVARVQADARVPVFSHLEGICMSMWTRMRTPTWQSKIVLNAKMRRTGICGSAETILVDRAVAPVMLPKLIRVLTDAGCEVRGDAATQAAAASVKPASEDDWSTEYLDAIVSMRVVDGVDEAMDHIARYGSQHTEAIITGQWRHGGDISAHGRFGDCAAQCLDAICRWRGVRLRRRDRHRHGQAACAGAGRRRTAHHLQVPGAGQRADAALMLRLPPFGHGQRIGLFGGSFNPGASRPLHGGALCDEAPAAGLGVVAGFAAEPAEGPSETGEYGKRLAYTRRIARHPRFIVTDLEEQIHTRYTAQTLEALKGAFTRGHFVWIMGADSLANLHRWHHWTDIMESLPIAVLARPGYSIRALQSPAATRFAAARVPQHLAASLATRKPPAFAFVTMPLRKESSTAIRKRRKPA
jgi:nicotinate (nicotinamide) nucleotide adenylyltransferase